MRTCMACSKPRGSSRMLFLCAGCVAKGGARTVLQQLLAVARRTGSQLAVRALRSMGGPPTSLAVGRPSVIRGGPSP